MRPNARRYVVAIALCAASGAVPAVPFSVIGDSGFPATQALVSLNDASTDALDSLTVLIEFDASRLKFVSAAAGQLFAASTSVGQNPLGTSSLIVGISSNVPQSVTGGNGSLLNVNFDILAGALPGLANVSFRCVPDNPNESATAVTDQASANSLCQADYAIPLVSGNVEVLAVTQAPVPGTAALALLGLGLMSWIRRKQSRSAQDVALT